MQLMIDILEDQIRAIKRRKKELEILIQRD